MVFACSLFVVTAVSVVAVILTSVLTNIHLIRCRKIAGYTNHGSTRPHRQGHDRAQPKTTILNTTRDVAKEDARYRWAASKAELVTSISPLTGSCGRERHRSIQRHPSTSPLTASLRVIKHNDLGLQGSGRRAGEIHVSRRGLTFKGSGDSELLLKIHVASDACHLPSHQPKSSHQRLLLTVPLLVI